MKTQKYINETQSQIIDTQTQINNFQAQIDLIQQQLNEFQQRMRVISQLETAQETAQKELKQWLNSFISEGKKLLKDACSVFPEDFLDDIQEEINEQFNEVKAEIKENYQKYSESNRFLDSETQKEQDQETQVIEPKIEQFNILVEPLNNEDLPDKNDDEIILNHQQLKVILAELDPSTVTKIQEMLGISKRVKTVSSIAFEIERLNKITYRYLTQLIELSNAQTLLLNGNGKH